MSRILLIAAEASADRLAARVISEAKKLGAMEFIGIGGDKCKAVGMTCYYTPAEMSVVGFFEVAKRYSFFRRVFEEMVARLDDPKTRPDKILLVDYPGFNIRFAAEAKKRNIEVIYFVSPQVWAWKPSRVEKIVASVSRMLVIFPFEVDIYKKAGLAQTEFVGHPLVEIIDEEKKTYISREAFANKYRLNPTQGWLLVFAGSRNEEVRRHLDIMCKAAGIVAAKLNLQPIVVESPIVTESLYTTAPKSFSHFRNAEDTHQLMNYAQLGILKSGTTTLEAALAGLPGVICYKTSWPTYWMARMLVTLNYIGLANIVLGKQLYPELLQSAMTPSAIADELMKIDQKQFKAELASVRSMLESEGSSPSKNVAQYLS
jgi:lipid-A-disaccharide synthase